MAFTFPLSIAAFLDRLPVQTARFHCPAQVAATGLAGGEVITSEIAPAMWQGSFSLKPMRPRIAAQLEVLLEALSQPGASFYAYKPNQIGPASDPLGVQFMARPIEIEALDFSGSRIALRGLPPGFKFHRGDFFSFDYGSAPRARALHRFQIDVWADAQGKTPLASVGPHIEPGAIAGTAVALIRPTCKAVIVPGSVDFGSTAGNITSGITFSFRQTFR